MIRWLFHCSMSIGYNYIMLALRIQRADVVIFCFLTIRYHTDCAVWRSADAPLGAILGAHL